MNNFKIIQHANFFWGVVSILISSTFDALAVPVELSKDARSAVFIISAEKSEGTGFACIYKNREFVATNQHVLAGASIVSVKSQNGESITLSGQIIAADDADICLLPIQGKFSDSMITPFEFVENVFDDSKIGDSVNCLGNSLGNGVITSTTGSIKAYGQPKLEIDSPVVKGNSGGPVVQTSTGKVVGLVTEAVINKLTFDSLGVAASKSSKSGVTDISYFAHRIDTVKKWTNSSLEVYSKNQKIIDKGDQGLIRTTLFLANKDGQKDGWEQDPRLLENWREYQKFLGDAQDKSSQSVQVTEYRNDYGVLVRRDVRVRSKTVSEADFVKALDRFLRGVEWKVLADQELLKKVKPIGYLQREQLKLALSFSVQVMDLIKNL